MKIAIIGKVHPGLTYDEWVKKFETNHDVKSISQINITIGNGILNQYVRKYAVGNNIPVSEYSPNYKAYGDEAKRQRNLALIDNSDLLVCFLPKGSPNDSLTNLPGISSVKRAVVSFC